MLTDGQTDKTKLIVTFRNFSKNTQITCGRTEEQTDKTKLIVAFRNFANAPKTTPNHTAVVQKTVTYSKPRNSNPGLLVLNNI